MKMNLAIDAVAFALYAAVSYPFLTGVGLHEWAGMLLFVLFVLHCAAHLDWVADALRGFRDGFSFARQGNLLLDFGILLAFTAVTVSGLGISGTVLPALGLVSSGYFIWGPMHAFSAKALLVLLLAHVVAHWRWIAKSMGKKESGNAD